MVTSPWGACFGSQGITLGASDSGQQEGPSPRWVTRLLMSRLREKASGEGAWERVKHKSGASGRGDPPSGLLPHPTRCAHGVAGEL